MVDVVAVEWFTTPHTAHVFAGAAKCFNLFPDKTGIVLPVEPAQVMVVGIQRQALLPVQFLRQLIGFYGGQMQGVLPSYLEMSLANFGRQQEQFASQMGRAFGTGAGATLMEDAARANMAMFERAIQMFPAFTYPRAEPTPAASDEKAETAPPPEAPDALDEMRRQMDEMRSQLDKLSKGG